MSSSEVHAGMHGKIGDMPTQFKNPLHLQSLWLGVYLQIHPAVVPIVLRNTLQELQHQQGRTLPFPGNPDVRLPCLLNPPPAGLDEVFEACCHVQRHLRQPVAWVRARLDEILQAFAAPH